MDIAAYLKARGWTLYRKPFEGKPAQWVFPNDNKVYAQSEAVKLERANET